MDGNRQIGVIAQELETVLPEVVRDDEAGQLSVAYGDHDGGGLAFDGDGGGSGECQR